MLGGIDPGAAAAQERAHRGIGGSTFRHIPSGHSQVWIGSAGYIKAGAWAVGGTWICKRDLMEASDFAKMSELMKEALQIIRAGRPRLARHA